MTTVGRITQLSDRALNRLNADMIKNLEGNPMTVMRCAIHQKNHTVFEPCPDCRLEDDEMAREAVVPEDRRSGERRSYSGAPTPIARRKNYNGRRIIDRPMDAVYLPRLIHLGLLLSAHVQEGNLKEARAVAKAFDEQLDSIKEG